MLGKGKAKAINDGDIARLADEIPCHPADLESIAMVESGGFGWFKDGRMKILPEPHVFNKQLPVAKRQEARRLGLATTSFKATRASGHYKRMGGSAARYAFLKKMIALDKDAAFESISMGTYQIMGFNYKVCGFKSAEEMWEKFLDSEANQLEAFSSFLGNNGLYGALKNRDFNRIEKGYNGGGLKGKYARRMKIESDRLRAGKWKNYKPGGMRPVLKAPLPNGDYVGGPTPAPKPPEYVGGPTPAPKPPKSNAPKVGVGLAALAALAAAAASYLSNLPCDLLGMFCGG